MKRFYRSVGVEETSLGWQVTLDGRALRTQGGLAQALPTETLARMLAREWADQGEVIDPAQFRMRDIADYALDMVAADPQQVIERLLRYAETDTLCYRADPDEPFHRRQQDVWEPLVAALESREGVRMTRVSGVIHRPQPAATLRTLRARLETLDAFVLAALETLASLTASLCIGLAALEAGADPEKLWDAANLEEDWQAEQWGVDEEAATRRARRKAEFLAAMEFARAAN